MLLLCESDPGHNKQLQYQAMLPSPSATMGTVDSVCDLVHSSPVYEKWAVAITDSEWSRSRVEYTYEGSDSAGIECLANGYCHFAGTDSALSQEIQRQMPDVWLVPVLAGAVAVCFNLPNFAGMQLMIPREALAAIFLGRMLHWSELAPWNPALANVQQAITLIVRSDSSAISNVFTSALSSFSTEWAGKVGTTYDPNWPKPSIRAEGDRGVALQVLVTPYSLGYLSLACAVSYDVPAAHISNAEGVFVAPTAGSIQEAMDAFASELSEIGRLGKRVFFQSIVDPKNQPGGYPIAMLTYFAFDAKQLNCVMLYNLIYLIHWAWTDLQASQIAMELSASAVSTTVRDALLPAFRTLKCAEGHIPAADTSLQDISDMGISAEQPFEKVTYAYSPAIIGAGAATP